MVKAIYGSAHQAARKRWAARLPLPCVFCGRPVGPGEPWDLDHQPGTHRYRGVAHPRCNRGDGGRRGQAQQAARKRAKRARIRMESVAVGVDIARDRSSTAVVIAGWAQHPVAGRVVTAVAMVLPGTAVAVDVARIVKRHNAETVIVNGSGAMRVLTESLRMQGCFVTEAGPMDVQDAHARTTDGLRDGLVRPQPSLELDRAAQWAAGRDLADGQAVDKRKSEADASPLVALELAVWAVLRAGQAIPWAEYL